MKILVTDPIAEAGLERLREPGHEVTTAYDAQPEDLPGLLADAAALIVRSGTTVTRDLIEAADNLVIIGRAGVGVDNIDIDAATEHGVIVANAPEANVRAAAEHTVAMTLATARSIPQAHARLKAGEWAKSDYLGAELTGKTLGIVGLGRVGQEAARRFDGLGMDLIAYDPYLSIDRADQLGVELVSLEDCLTRADFLTIHTPLTPETEGMLGPDELARLDGGYLINCARGGIVDETALAEAVQDGTLAGAAVDVFETEPVDPDNPLLRVDNIVVTPHLGASTQDAQEKVATVIADQINAALAREPVENALNAPSIDHASYAVIKPYIELAETSGTVAAQLLGDRIETIEVRYEGEIADGEVDLVTASALQGVLTPLEWQVNAVNASRIADRRGVDVTESKTHRTEDFRSLVSVAVGNKDETVTVSGTIFTGGDPRIVRINGFRVDAIPHGHMLVTRNRDVPGVIGFIGMTLGDHDINIAGMFNARETIGGEALTVYNLDDPVSRTVLDVIRSDDRITEAKYIGLDTGVVRR